MSLIKNYLHQLQTMNRSELQKDMVDAIVDGMDMEMLCQLACDALSTTYDEYSDDELMEEVKEYYPHLLEPSISELEATADDYGVGK
jgi:hypothetical protein